MIRINVSRRRLRIPRSPQNLINESPEFSLAGTSPYLKFRMTALRRIINGAVELPVFRAILRLGCLQRDSFVESRRASTYFARFAPRRPSKVREKEGDSKCERESDSREKDTRRVSFRADYNSIDVRTYEIKLRARARDVFSGARYRSGYVATVALIAIDD